jgi:hypothetical protein
MDTRLCDAITNRKRILLIYSEKERIVEPQCYGISTRDKEVLRAFQIGGESYEEKLFEVNKIQFFTVLNEGFNSPGPNYRKGDSAMKTIFCEL